MKVVGGEAEHATEKSERAAGDVSAGADSRILTEWNDCLPPVVQHSKSVADGRTGFDCDRSHLPVVVDALHWRDIDDHAHVRIRDEAFEAMSAAGDDQPLLLIDCVLDGSNDLLRGIGQDDVVGPSREPLVESLVDDGAIPWVVGRNSI